MSTLRRSKRKNKTEVYHTVSLKYNEFSLYVFMTTNFRYLPLKHGNSVKYFADCHVFIWNCGRLPLDGIGTETLHKPRTSSSLFFFFHHPDFWEGFSLALALFFSPPAPPPSPTLSLSPMQMVTDLSWTTLWCSSATWTKSRLCFAYYVGPYSCEMYNTLFNSKINYSRCLKLRLLRWEIVSWLFFFWGGGGLKGLSDIWCGWVGSYYDMTTSFFYNTGKTLYIIYSSRSISSDFTFS